MDTSTRLWFFSRTISFVSKAFDFIKDPKSLIRFILATSFASNEEMGYDLTVERVKNDAKVWVYDYEVADEDGKSTWYRTVDCLWTHRSGRISGRGNRVWEVQELDENRNPAMQKGKPKSTCVLKDYWVNCDAIRESAKRNEIIDRALAKNPGLQRRDIEKHFMTILHDIYVKCHDGNGALVDDTSEVQLRGWLLPEEYSEFLLEMPTNKEYTKPQIRNGARSLTTGASGSALSTQSSSQHDQPSAPTNPSRIVLANRVDGPRRHCRTIFRELGTRLDELTDQRAFIQSLIDALQGLKFLYDAEYLHCDMSDGNLLWCYDSDHDLMICKILDLEYARPHLQSNEENYRPHNHRTVIYNPIYVDTPYSCRLSRAPQHSWLWRYRPIIISSDLNDLSQYLTRRRKAISKWSQTVARLRNPRACQWQYRSFTIIFTMLRESGGLWFTTSSLPVRATRSANSPTQNEKSVFIQPGLSSFLSVWQQP
ncbi:hypothetical protein PM082_015848 [Marasmius tenuissimus]|nr:hypothetical protein PM082_015848 [Marasmius tenuissimus]